MSDPHIPRKQRPCLTLVGVGQLSPDGYAKLRHDPRVDYAQLQEHEPFPLQPYTSAWVHTPSGPRDRTEPQPHCPRARRTGLVSVPVFIPPPRRRPETMAQTFARYGFPTGPSRGDKLLAGVLVCWLIAIGVVLSLHL